MLTFQSAADSLKSARHTDTPEARKARLEYWRDEVLSEMLFNGGARAHTAEAYGEALAAVRKDEAEPE